MSRPAMGDRKPGTNRKPPRGRADSRSLGPRWEDQLAAAIKRAEVASGKTEREKRELGEWRKRKAKGEC